jgi:hypothetical protein
MSDKDDSSSGPFGDPENAPKVKNIRGKWDEVVAAFILIAPWIIIVIIGLYVILSGSLSTDITISGEIPVNLLVIGAALLIGATYILAALKFFGSAPVAWLGNKVHNVAKNYNPDE